MTSNDRLDPTTLTWRKSSRSNGQSNCVEIAWRKSSRSNGQSNCVEIADAPDGVFVRDSKNPHEAVLAFTPSEWSAFVGGVKDGEFDN